MASEPLHIFDPRRNLQLQGFAGRAATTTIHDATETGVSISGIFQAARGLCGLGLVECLRLLQPPAAEAPAEDRSLRPEAGVRHRVRPDARRRDPSRRGQVPIRLLGRYDVRHRRGRHPRRAPARPRNSGVRQRDCCHGPHRYQRRREPGRRDRLAPPLLPRYPVHGDEHRLPG